MKLQNEQQLLDQNVRAEIIKHIKCADNKARKDEAYKRYECYKDKTFLYVMRNLLLQFDKDTVQEMSYAVSNLGLVRKVIDKLARVYKYGVTRKVIIGEPDAQAMDAPDADPAAPPAAPKESASDKATAALEAAAKECDIDQMFKKTNRFMKLEKNVVQYIVPKPYDLAGETKTIKTMVLPPYLYDVVELDEDHERAVCYVLSDYKPGVSKNPAQAIVGTWSPTPQLHGNNVLELPVYGSGAAKDNEAEKESYVFWSDNLHFTCDEKGNITSVGDNTNPIGEMPFVNYSEDQDGCFWAEGGSDLVDGAILVNSMITNINHIAITQGYGQVVMTGKELPQGLKVGPNKIVKLNYVEGEPTPTFAFVSANPPLDQLRSLVEMYVALLLTTNNLSTSGVQSNLNGGSQFPSGIAMMIDKAESMEDVEDQRQVFIDNEPKFWEIFSKWHRVLKAQGILQEDLAAIDLPEEMELSLDFAQPAVIETEKERLEALQLKDTLGLVTKLDMLKSEYPNLTDEQLKMKLEEVMSEKLEAMKQAQEAMGGNQVGQDNQDGNGSDSGASGNGFGKKGSGGVPSGTDPNKRGEAPKPDNG